VSKTAGQVVEEAGAAAPAEPVTPAAYIREVGKATARRPRGPIVLTLPATVRVSFEEPAEFVQELEELAAEVERGIVRYTLRYDPPGEGYGMRKVELVVSAIAEGEIFELVAKARAARGPLRPEGAGAEGRPLRGGVRWRRSRRVISRG
jgi:hypothetical protein